jgi:ribonucleoside-diphosphate reductase alpha chain
MPARVWSRKYRLRDKADNFLEDSPLQTFCRMADAVKAPSDSTLRQNLVERRFIPAGRVLFALGNSYYRATMKNCYVLALADDSLEAISDLRKDMARTYAMGGGVGIDLTCLRPAGAPVKNCAITSSGAASFADGFSHLTGEIGQNGRRGALMISLSVDHPDIERFVHTKNDFNHQLATRIREKLPRKLYKQLNEEVIEPRRACGNANMSVRITDRFMKAVKTGKHHITRFIMDDGHEITEVFDAKSLFRQIVEGAWSHGCPGCLFWDTMAREDNRNYLDPRWHIITTNPCGEQPLSDGGSCNLGAINLSRFTTHSYTDCAVFDWDGYKQAIRDGVRFLDEINTVELRENRAPISKQAEVTEGLRQIGLGVMGYGDLLLQHQIRYGSDDAMILTEKLFRTLRDTAYHESIMLAKEKGPFPAYDWDKIKRSPFIDRLPGELKKLMEKHGLRNSNVLSIAPTGTIAIMGETTGGIEPEFAYQLTRAAQLGSGKRTKFTFLTPTAQRIAKALGKSVPQGEIEGAVDMSWLPDWAVASHQIEPKRRAKVQGLIQQFIDTAISSTVNLPEDATVEDVMDVYWTAYEAGCKGVTIYREGSREGILQTLQEEERLEYPIEPPLQINSRRISFKGEHGLQRILINVGDYRPGVPCETSIIHGKSGTEVASYASALGIVISIALQNGVHPIKIARAMEGINAGWAARLALDGKGNKPTTVQSVPDAVAAALRKFYGNGIYEKGVAGQPINGETNKSGWELTAEERNIARICPKCQKQTYIPDSSCWRCINPACDVEGICG